MSTVHHFEMGLARADFVRLLPAAVGFTPFRIAGDTIVATDAHPPWRIDLAERPGRAFGALEVPVLAVTLVLETADAAAADRFVERFLRGFQRAGG